MLHLVRTCRFDNSDRHFEVLYRTLRQRVLARTPIAVIGRGSDGEVLISQARINTTEAVMDRFQELLMLDRTAYEDRLDYFEINFDDAIAALRLTARKKAWKEENRSVPMTYDDETSELNVEIEEAAAAQNPLSEPKLDDLGYRLRLDAAIDALPEHQRRVVTLLRLGFPIDSKEAGVQTIVGTLGCAEKTVRNRRDKAYEAIRKALEEEES
ncbi:DNA-binding response regulator [Afipia felis]|uniref:DNA-binding response regulator n=1 Tax=Afipia felis TaxID=1035 RepID=UPI0012E2967C|nr:DNA-binding response regulator [Afipia felis]